MIINPLLRYTCTVGSGFNQVSSNVKRVGNIPYSQGFTDQNCGRVPPLTHQEDPIHVQNPP